MDLNGGDTLGIRPRTQLARPAQVVNAGRTGAPAGFSAGPPHLDPESRDYLNEARAEAKQEAIEALSKLSEEDIAEVVRIVTERRGGEEANTGTEDIRLKAKEIVDGLRTSGAGVKE